MSAKCEDNWTEKRLNIDGVGVGHMVSQLYGLISPNADLDGCGSLQSLLHPVNLVFSFLEVLNTGLTVYSISGGNLTKYQLLHYGLVPRPSPDSAQMFSHGDVALATT